MKINLIPQGGREEELFVLKSGNSLTVNNEMFDFSRMLDGDILPSSAIESDWFVNNIINTASELELTLILPLPWNYSQEQAFPVPLVDVPDGLVNFPRPLSEEETQEKLAQQQESLEQSHNLNKSRESGVSAMNGEVTEGVIDWSKLSTRAMRQVEAEANQRVEDVIEEDAWRNSEVEFIADQLLAIEDDDPTALPGTDRQWRDYRIKVRAWKDGGNSDFPYKRLRPTRPK